MRALNLHDATLPYSFTVGERVLPARQDVPEERGSESAAL